MEKLDLAKKYRAYYTAKLHPELATIEAVTYLSIPGQGDPSSEGFAEKIEALYTVAYGVKFLSKANHRDFVVPKLEGLWWFDEDAFGGVSMADAPLKIPRHLWYYRLLIRMPDFITPTLVTEASAKAFQKRKAVTIKEVGLHDMKQRTVVQMLHTGAFSREPETLERMQMFIMDHKLTKAGLHQEVYLSDFRKTAEAKLRTILREPVETTDPI